MPIHKKTCKRKGCGKEFESASRNERYCPACKVPARVMRRRNRKRRIEYVKEQQRLREEARSRKIARELQIQETEVECEYCHHKFPIAKLEAHHKDGNPHNNAKENRAWICESCHKSESRKQQAKKDKEKDESKIVGVVGAEVSTDVKVVEHPGSGSD